MRTKRGDPQRATLTHHTTIWSTRHMEFTTAFTAQDVLTGLTLGHSLFAVSYLGISLVKHAIKYCDRYSLTTSPEACQQFLTTVADIQAAATQPETELDYHLGQIDWGIRAQVLAMTAAAIIITGNTPVATAQPALPGFQPAGLLQPQSWPASQVRNITEDLYSMDVDDITLDSINAFEARMNPIQCAPVPLTLWATDAKFAEIRTACRAAGVKPGRSRAVALSTLLQRIEEWGVEVV